MRLAILKRVVGTGEIAASVLLNVPCKKVCRLSWAMASAKKNAILRAVSLMEGTAGLVQVDALPR